ncbi:MAG: nitrophenyl compound nitroreductase subunit ArsF family protein [Armatimonadota bacterium]
MMNNTKKAVIIILVFFLACLIFTSNKNTANFVYASGNNQKVTVYYFHGNSRCANCIKIEKYVKEAVYGNFSKELKNKKLEFKVINVDEKKNNHFANDYKLYTKSVILSYDKNGKELEWKNLDKIWQLLGNKQAFQKYIVDEINSYLKKA